MLEVFGLEIWIISIACSGFLGWVLGRDKKPERTVEPQQTDRDVDIPPSPPQDEAVCQPGMPPASDRAPTAPRHRARRARNTARASVFADMPPLDVVSDKARAIRSDANVWDKPDISEMLEKYFEDLDTGSRAVLTKFRASVEKLEATAEATEKALRQ